MASIVSFLQNELLTLSNEARKKYPDIKDASERVIMILRPLKDRPVNEICAELAKSDEVSRPFYLACDTKQAKLVSIAVGGLQRLVSHRAIADSAPALRQLIHTLADVTSLGMEVQVKALQTLLPLITQFQALHMELVADTLNICFRLAAVKDGLVSNTAAATLRQLVIFLFDKVPLEDGLEESITSDLGRVKLAPSSIDSLRPCARDAYLVFVDLCSLASGTDATTFLAVQSLPRAFALELLESVLANHAAVFERHIEFSHVLSQSVCPMVIKTYPERHDYSQSVRLMRVVHLLVHKFASILVMECEVFLSLLLKSLDNDHGWPCALALEALVSLCAQPRLLYNVFCVYDQQKQSTNIFRDLLTGLHKLITSDTQGNLLAAAPARVQCIDQLDKSDPPSVSEDYEVYLAVQCVYGVVTSLEAVLGEPDAVAMVETAWSALLASLSHLLKYTADVVPYVQIMAVVCGRAGLTAPRDAFLTLLSRQVTANAEHAPACLHAVLGVAQELMDSLDGGAWFLVFEIACYWERFRASGKAGSAASSNATLPSPPRRLLTPTSPTGVANGASAAGVEPAPTDPDGQLRHLLSATRELPDDALVPIFNAMCQFNSIPTMAFAVDKLRQLVIIHLHRLLSTLPEVWVLVIQHFVFIASNTQNIELQLQACETICHVATQGIHLSQAKVLAPLKELAALTGDVPKRALQTLHSLLQVHGQSISEWPLVYAILQSSVAEDALVRIAFPSLELLCADYLPTNPAELDQCIATLRIYALQSADVNISLTCIRLLWTIADSAHARKTHWLAVLQQLTLICKDRRPQVRNGCVTSLFRAVASAGTRLHPEQWDTCICDIVLPLLDATLHCNTAAPAPAASSAGLVMHHSRDTAEKQWDETRVLAIQGLGALFATDAFRAPLARHVGPVLAMAARYVLEASLEVRVATAKVLGAFAAEPALEPAIRAELYACWSRIVVGLEEYSGTLDRSAPLPPRTLSHDFVHLLVLFLRSLLAAEDSVAALAPVAELLDRLEAVLRLLRAVPDHSNDTEHLGAVQSDVVDVAMSLREPASAVSGGGGGDPVHLRIQFLARAASLPLQAPTLAPGNRHPTYLALARTAMSRAVDATKSSGASGFSAAATAALATSLAAFLTIAHPLHEPAVDAVLALVAYLCPAPGSLEPAVADEATLHLLVAAVVDAYLRSRPNAHDASEAKDAAALAALMASLPHHLADADLTVLVHAVDAAARFTSVSALDAAVASAMTMTDAEPETPTTAAERTHVRESFAAAALTAQFDLARRFPASSALPVLLARVRGVLSAYVADTERTGGSVPLPRLRDAEVELVLAQLAELEINTAAGVPHLVALYPVLVDTVPALRHHPAALGKLCMCLRRAGAAFGAGPN
ncbi:Endocytosis and vacuole integrity protein [Blastocladiella emersonii ATCC 22665]|nr:Endocytosis and vacuole integrity protein [Blastocladiella emersonii ATCC 22665]